jgi:hypothetical protein
MYSKVHKRYVQPQTRLPTARGWNTLSTLVRMTTSMCGRAVGIITARFTFATGRRHWWTCGRVSTFKVWERNSYFAIHKWLLQYELNTSFQQPSLIFASVELVLWTDGDWLTSVFVVTGIYRATVILEFHTHIFQCTAVHSRPLNEIDWSCLRTHRTQSLHIHRSSCWMHNRASMLDRCLPLSVDDRGWIQTRIQQCGTHVLGISKHEFNPSACDYYICYCHLEDHCVNSVLSEAQAS